MAMENARNEERHWQTSALSTEPSHSEMGIAKRKHSPLLYLVVGSRRESWDELDYCCISLELYAIALPPVNYVAHGCIETLNINFKETYSQKLGSL